MADTFSERAAWGEGFATAVAGLLENDRFIDAVSRNGIEWSPLAPVMRQIRSAKGPMAARLRFNPDGTLMLGNVLAHWEAKASKTIERGPYEQYMKYEEAGEPVLMFLCPRLLAEHVALRPVFCCRVSNLVLVPAEESISKFSGDMQFPIVDGWLSPRTVPRGAAKGSGTDYREVDVDGRLLPQVAKAKRKSAYEVAIQPHLYTAEEVRRSLC
jgi:hypothetical protein